ncbi:MAG TPA: UDP-N-acetylmuramate dehydrogenase [Myxococcota bacterium]|nr:UDP-N-acetylmuramate dehydrogenase [Myxococcota bacterium]
MPGQVSLGESLAGWTSLRVGGPADALVRAESRDDLERVARFCQRHGLPLLVLGGGFNLLVRDGGVRGVVVRLAGLRRVELAGADGVRAEAGASHSQVTRFAADHGRAGLEFAVGIPGTVGGWIAMNAGTRAREMKDVVRSVELFDPAPGRVVTRARAELAFHYRRSELPAGALVLAATFATTADAPERIRERQKQLLAERRATQPVDQPSCGSVFVNPPGDFAGRLLEAAGLKGTRIGGAVISPLHANFIVNAGGARAADVLALIAKARQSVREASGIALQTEVHIVGEDA